MAQQGRVANHKLNDGLTPKQAKFVEGIAQGKSSTVAALEAYETDNYHTAAVVASENLNKPKVRDAVLNALEHHSLTAIDAVRPVKEAIDFKGDTKRESLEVNLKGVDRYLKLLAMTEDRTDKGSSTTLIFNNGTSSNNFVKK